MLSTHRRQRPNEQQPTDTHPTNTHPYLLHEEVHHHPGIDRRAHEAASRGEPGPQILKEAPGATQADIEVWANEKINMGEKGQA